MRGIGGDRQGQRARGAALYPCPCQTLLVLSLAAQRTCRRTRGQPPSPTPKTPSTSPPSRDTSTRDHQGTAGMRIEIICTGDEVLTGKIVNSNFSYMAQKLEDFGLAVRWGTTVGDDRETLLAAFRQAGERADAVIVNGGLGPTVDDLSQEIAAQAAGVELVLNEGWLTTMEAYLPAPRPGDAAQQPQAGDAAGHRRGARQPGRHRLRLRGRYRQGAVLLHARRAARAPAHAGGADPAAPSRARRRQVGHPPEALPFLRDRRIACRFAARRDRETGAPRAASSSASAPITRSSRPSSWCAAPMPPRSSACWRRCRARCASASAISSSPRTTGRSKAWCSAR